MKSYRYLAAAALLSLCLLPKASLAQSVQIRIADASLIKYAVSADGNVYLRNISDFDNTWLGCCQYYWIPLNTDSGKAMYSAMLSAAMTHTPIFLYGPKTGGAIVQVGQF
ncbi:hypothetical protein AZA_14921 [Nitrospirillum viridazoti Y2]|uniref:Uncharacterized protein n=1 Tax=Nitrospirillum amazonense TaxID=28077 RepID=A0A560HVF0_9PROT|nr:hypothetical protein [Nitrospirillum amazonense]EGY02704.1 hypothetical protein AZA_14921 [Nitrospirillum amazonense Y2]TWB48960.1 hypothetical protein FBZ92_12762 [Nitrospirillum amazonense]